ncbi:MAG: DUF3034 family protein [bacterium]
MKAIGRMWKHVSLAVAAWSLATAARSGVPLNAIEGYGGAAFNPFAYIAGQNTEESKAPLCDAISKGQFGAWYGNLGDVDVDWMALGTAFSVGSRIELSYGYEVVAPNGKNLQKNDIGAKLNVIPENLGDNPAIPAVSLGAVAKSISDATDADESGYDYYAVATKLITQTPIPVLVSGGALSTQGRVTGVFGFDDDRDITAFGNIDVIPLSFLAFGFEYKQGAQFSDFKNADYWDAHVGWLANKNLTLIAAYVDAGDNKSTSKVGLGDGVVVSAQYAF